MNKKLIATAMGLVLAGGMGFANADVKLYGQLDLSVDSLDVDGGEDDINMGANRSSFGVKGTEDLGNGLNAFFQLEWQVDIDDADIAKSKFNEDESGNGFYGRDQFLGLKGESWGKLTLGTMSTAYKSDAAKLDPMYRTRIQARNTGLQSVLHKGKGENGEGRATNTVRYDTPSWSGVSGTFHYTLDNDKTDANDDDPWGAGIRYSAGNIYAFADYITSSADGDNEAYQLGAKYTMNDFAFWGMYEFDKGLISTLEVGSALADAVSLGYITDADCGAVLGDPTATCADLADAAAGEIDGHDIWNIGASYTIGNNLISAGFGMAEDYDDINYGEYTTWQIAAQHNFSQRTKVYAGYSNTDVDDGPEADLFTVGLRHNF